MGELLSIIAIVGLIALVVVSVTRQRAGKTRTKADEDLRTEGADVQATVPCAGAPRPERPRTTPSPDRKLGQLTSRSVPSLTS